MVYRDYNDVLKKLGTYEPVWFLEWNVSSISNVSLISNIIGKTKVIEGIPIPIAVEGMFLPIDEQTGIFSSPKETLFVPFKDDAKTYDSESLDFTMAREMGLYSTICWIFADSKDECYQQYVAHLKELAKKISDFKIKKYEDKLENIRIIIDAIKIEMQTPEEIF